MSEEEDKEIELLLDRLYQTDVVINNLKHDFELRLAKTKTECRAFYKGKELKINIDLLGIIRGERLGIMDKARTNIKIEIIEDYVKRKMEG